jgi:hypothetical protein
MGVAQARGGGQFPRRSPPTHLTWAATFRPTAHPPGSHAPVRSPGDAPLETIDGVSTSTSGNLSIDLSNPSRGLTGTATIPTASLRTGNADMLRVRSQFSVNLSGYNVSIFAPLRL